MRVALIAVGLGLLVVAASSSAAGVQAGDAGQPRLEPALGDVDCSLSVDSVDALFLLRHVAALAPLGIGCLHGGADTNCDGQKDAADALNILRHVAGLGALTAGPCRALALTFGCGTQPVTQGTYIALGDSLSEGIGATMFQSAFVPRVHRCLGAGFELFNLGHSGDTSAELISHGHLGEAVFIIQDRNNDADPANDVHLVTLVIGGNDLLALFFSLVLTGICPSLDVALNKPECVQALQNTLAAYRPNLDKAVAGLQAADADLTIVLMTLYDPFSGSPLTAFSELATIALEGMEGTPVPEGMNDIIRDVALRSGVPFADIYPLFLGRSGELVSGDLIHPNNNGYRVMAEGALRTIAIEYSD
jgi:lysophospholipase L1-like esterase